MLALYNIITCINSILYLNQYNLTFLFSMHWSSLFILFYILSLRISFSCIINIYFMNIIIWSWVHSRLRGMQRLIRDKSVPSTSTSISPIATNQSSNQSTSSSFNTQSSKCTNSSLDSQEYLPTNDWWTIIYHDNNHCLFRRSLFSITY